MDVRWRARLRAAAIGGHEERGEEIAGATRRLPENLRFSLDAVSARRARTARLGRCEVRCCAGRDSKGSREGGAGDVSTAMRER